MDRNEAWRIGDERRRNAQEILMRCGIEAEALCALSMASGGDEPVGRESIITVAMLQGGDSDRNAVIAIVDDDGNPKACSTKPMSANEAEEVRLRVIWQMKGSAAADHTHSKEVV